MTVPKVLDEGQIRLCNACGKDLIVWLEPWALEFTLPARSTLVLVCDSETTDNPVPEIETDDEIITVWGRGGSRIAVFVDGVDQQSFSAGYPAPDMGQLSSRNFVDLVFGDHPETRPGGLPLPRPRSGEWWRRLFRFLGK